MPHKNVTKVVWYIFLQLSSLIEKIPSTKLHNDDGFRVQAKVGFRFQVSGVSVLAAGFSLLAAGQ
jgi:galactitol-specific phosphotransferase system IIC component